MNQEMAMVVRNNEEREALKNVIIQWNANRLDLFELSLPDQNLEFHGVMRFYFQDSGQKVATKCIRVASNATAQVVIETLIEKFRPDMRMLSIPEYALYEIHENGEERRLEPDEKPLLVQLNWHSDDREGRFLLRRIDDTTNMPETFQEGSSFKRKLSKREKKQLKKQEKLNRLKNPPAVPNDENDSGVAEKLYTELPETSFTRSISNPEAVMRRRRQQQLEKKLQQFRSKDGGPDTGGTLKIYGEALCRDVPYKTLLLSIGDTAAQVVREMLNKYGLDKEEPHHYCLVQVNTAIEEAKDNGLGNNNTINNREYILDDDECPLAILMKHPTTRGSIMFHVRRRPADYLPRKRKKKPQQGKWSHNELMDRRYDDGVDRLPFFLELNPDGSEIAGGNAKRYCLQPNVTEVGGERVSPHGHGQSLQLFGPNIQPRHCVIAHTEGIVTVTPCSRDAETYVNGQRIFETTILQHGASVKFGRIHNFRFLDPCHDERVRQRHDSSRSPQESAYDRQSTREETSSISVGNGPTSVSTPSGNPLNYETTFDVDGNVETRSTSSQGNKDDTRSQRSISSSREGNRLSNYDRYPRGTDAILPAVLEIREETEEALLHAIITDLDPTAPSFKLAPAFTLYLIARYRASTHYRPELTPTERAHRLTLMLARVAGMIHNVIQERYCEVKCLAMWLANASELLHFLKCDRHISAFSLDAQDTLADAVQIAFRHLVACFQGELSAVMPNFFSDRDDLSHDPEDSSTASVLGVLSSAMTFLRRCRVNAALTIQLFSQLFYYINVWAFNRVVAPNSTYCSRAWGLRLKARLAQIEVWAESQGLELAADCHLARITQAAHLLQAPKYTCEDLAALSNTYFKLNSLQLRALLQKYQPTPDEPRISHEVVDNVARVAENLADELARSDGREVRLEEDPELAVPFLLPEDGYSCEVTRGVPPGLVDFIAPLQHAGLCRLTSQPTSNGLWTVYMGPVNSMIRSPSAMSNRSASFVPSHQEPEIQTIKLVKSNNGIGLSIVAAKGAGQDRLGIYIKSVVKGGAADADGRLQAGDQLLKVDGQSLVGITQEKGAEYLVRTGPVVTLEVAKQGAIFHGLATLLSQPSPVMARVPRTQSHPVVIDRPGLCHNFTYSTEASPSSLYNGFEQPVPNRSSSPTVLRLLVPLITTTPPPPPSSTVVPLLPPDHLLSVPTTSRVVCYKVPPKTVIDLKKDIFQEHQARLVNCDSDDASAFQQRSADVVRNQKSTPDAPPHWFSSSLSRLNDCPKGNWYRMSGSKSWKSDFYLNKSGQWEKVNNSNYTSYKQRSKSVADLLDQLDSSSSECNCPEGSSSEESDVPPGLPKQTESEDSKLSLEERQRTLKELDEIVQGMSRITEFANQNLTLAEPKKQSPRQKLCFSGFSGTSSDSSEEGDFEYGSGRVAALAKHFSAMGEAGIIRGRLTRPRLNRSQCKSEPNVFNANEDCLNPKPGDVILHESAFGGENGGKYTFFLDGSGLEPVGFSMDRLIDIGQKLVKKEIKPKESVAVKVVIPETKTRDQVQQTRPHSDFELERRSPVQITDSKVETDSIVLKPKTNYPFLDPNRKSISVDEVEMRLKSRANHSKTKHYSLMDLAAEGVVGVAAFSDGSLKSENNEEKPVTVSGKSLRKFSSVDDSSTATAAELTSKIHLDSSTDKDSLRKRCGRADAIKSRKIKRMRKLELQRSVVVTPVRLHSRDNSGCSIDEGSLIFRSLDSLGEFDSGPSSRGAFTGVDESRPRRMSERDLPSRVLSEQQTPQGRSQFPPQIHSSKSVPSLNTDSHDLERPANINQTLAGNSTMPRPNHEVFNPGYSRTSSTTSIPQSQYQIRSRSNQNLSDPRVSQGNMPPSNHHLMNHRPPHMNSNYSLHQPPYLSAEHPSQPHHPPSSQHLPPHHVSPYQPQQPQPAQHYSQGGPAPSHPGAYQAQPTPSQLQAQLHQHPMQHQQNSPMCDNGERFYQNLGACRNQESTLPNGYIPPQNGVVRGKMPSPQDERTPISAMQKNLRGSQSSLQSRTVPDAANMSRDRPTSAYLPHNNFHPQAGPLGNQPGLQGRSQSSRDMLRQEAKLQEMTEEVRRREARVTSPQQRPNMGVIGSPIQGSPLRYPAAYPPDSYGNPRVPPHQEYADSPPPPPPPPTTTHPLYHTQLRPDSRYAASGNEPPRGSYSNLSVSSSQQQPQQQQGKQQMYYHGSNPWHKEEKEKEAERRRDVARHWRDQQIHELISLPHRNPQQEEHLRALKLEKEFERRAEELEEDDEEDQETAERIQGLLRVAHQSDERRSLRTPLPGNQLNAGGGSQSVLNQPNGTSHRPAISSGGSIYSGASAEEKARLQRLKELKMKQAEIEAERMKKKEEEARNQGLQSVPSYQVTSRTNVSSTSTSSLRANTTHSSLNLRLENLNISSPASSNNHYYNNNGYGSNHPSPAGQRLDLMIGQPSSNNNPNGGAPNPPERGSSFAIMSQQTSHSGQSLRSPSTPTMSTSVSSVTNNNSVNNAVTPSNNVTPTVGTTKRVSFQDPPPPMPASPPPLDNIREDPNNFINEAETMLASPTTPETSFSGGTPGVIGAQEVYRDPRQKRLAEQQRQNQLSNKAGAVPEKLSFKEKMKMFAMETGEDTTPKDKVKISRAQRDIDNLGGTPVNNNNNATPTSALDQNN